MLRRLFLLLLLALGGAAEAQSFPPFTGLVVDAANVLPAPVKADLTTKLQALQRDTKRQFVVATIPDLQGYPLDDYGYRLGRDWGVGLRDVNNGVVLFIAPNERPGHRGPRIEVGYGLEPIITDALASQIIDERMMPKLQAGDVPGAMQAGADAIIQQLRASPDEAKARTDAATAAFDKAHRRPRNGGGAPAGLVFWGVVLLFIVLPMLGRRRWGGSGYGGSNLPIALWGLGNAFGGESRGGGSGWSGGGGSDGSWGGGGFSGGGGGSFGGGGASGSW